MVVDTNSIPSAAIQRVEVISGGASAVYGADAVGGVVNFILKDNFEGASVDVRFGDTQHGGDQTVHISALFGANVGRRPRQRHDRHRARHAVEAIRMGTRLARRGLWRIRATAGGGFAFGSATWWHNEPTCG